MILTRYALFLGSLCLFFACNDHESDANQKEHKLIRESNGQAKTEEKEKSDYKGKPYELETPLPADLAGVYKENDVLCITDYCQTLNPGITINFENDILSRTSQTHQIIYVIDSIYPSHFLTDAKQFEMSYMSVRDSIKQESYAINIKYDHNSKLYTILGFPQHSNYEMLYDTLFADRNHSDHVPHMAEICN